MQHTFVSNNRPVAACHGVSTRWDAFLIPRPVTSAIAVCANQSETSSKVQRVHRRCYRKPAPVFAVPSASPQDTSLAGNNSGNELASRSEPQPLAGQQLAALQSIESAHGLQGVADALAALKSVAKHEQAIDLSHPQLSAGVEARLHEQDLASAPPRVLAALLTQAADAGVVFSNSWRAAVLGIAGQAIQGLPTSSASEARTVTQLLWGLSELGCDPEESWLQAAAQKVCACAQDASLLACDLSTCLAALGAMGYKPDPTWSSAMVEEVSYQLAEFQSDLEAGDVARLISGLADLKLGSQLSAEGNRLLMKAVYGKVRTIEDKAAVDFALAKLSAEERSMHYDPRWTHEELRWLPRRERDKRRIMSEGWYRTQWGGWAPGRGG